VFNILIGKTTGVRRFGKHVYEWDDNIEVVLKAIPPRSWKVYKDRTRTWIFCCGKFLEFL